MKKLSILATVVLFVFYLQLQLTKTYSQELTISEISVVGNKNFSDKEIIETLKKSMGESWKKWDERKYNYYTRKSLGELFFSKGYLEAHSGYNFQKTGNEVKVVIDVNEGVAYRIGNIGIEGLNIIPKENFLQMMGQKSGDLVNGKSLFEFLNDALNFYYRNRGYLQFSAVSEPSFSAPKDNETEGIVNLNIVIDEGRQFKIKTISIAGNVEDKLKILELLGISEREIFNQQKFENGIKLINSTNKFLPVDKDKDVEMRVDEEDNSLKLVIKVNKNERRKKQRIFKRRNYGNLET